MALSLGIACEFLDGRSGHGHFLDELFSLLSISLVSQARIERSLLSVDGEKEADAQQDLGVHLINYTFNIW